MNIEDKTAIVDPHMASWLQQQMSAHQIKGVDLARLLTEKGVATTPAYVSNMRRLGMSYKKAVEVASLMGWELPGRDTSQSDNLSPTPTSIVISTLTPQAGPLAHNNDNEILEQVRVPSHWLKATYPSLANINNLALCNIRGDSMEPTFDQEDTLLVDRSTSTFEVDGVYVFTYHDSLMIKRIQRRPGRGYVVISDNKDLYDAYDLPNEDLENVRVHGRVVGKFGFVKI